MGTSINDTSDTQEVFLKTVDYQWTVAHDETNEFTEKYGIIGFPSVYIIDPDGKVVTFGRHWKNWAEDLDLYVRELVEYLADDR